MKRMRICARGLLAAMVFLACGGARAGTFNFMGYGATNMGMANATVAVPTDAFSQVYNPALMTEQTKSILSAGLQGAITSFKSIDQVLVDRPDLGGSTNLVADVNTRTRDAFMSAIAYQTTVGHWERPLHFGIHLVVPVEHVFVVDTPDTFLPQYSMYMSDTQRMVGGITLAKSLTDDLSLGVGVDTFLVQGSTVRYRLPAGGNSTARLAIDIKAGLAPVAGLLEKLDENWKLGFSYRGKRDYRTVIDAGTTLALVNPADLVFTATSSVAYDPDMFIAGVSRSDDSDTVAFAAKWELWNGYSGGNIRMNFSTFNGSFSSYNPDTPFHDIISLHAGYDHKLTGGDHFRAGYAYVPTPVPDQSGETNILDSDKHEIYAGYGWRWKHVTIIDDGPLNLDLVGFLDYLMPKTVVKSQSYFIGAPGYEIGGMIYGYGVTATREF